jgi:hypothetical protein
MTLNEGLKGLSKDPYSLVLTHTSWPRNRYIQMSCQTKSVGGVGGVMSGPMTLKVISTINDSGYTEDVFSRKNFKAEKYNSGWVLLDSNTLVKRLLGKNKYKTNIDLKGTSIEIELTDDSIEKTTTFSQQKDVKEVIEYCKDILHSCEKEIDTIVKRIDEVYERDLPKEDCVCSLRDEIDIAIKLYVKDQDIKDLFIRKVNTKFIEIFPNMFGISENAWEFIRKFERDNNVDLNIDEAMLLPRGIAMQVIRDRMFNVKNKKSEENIPKKKRFRLKIFNRKK